MIGTALGAWRKYEAALGRLQSIHKHLSTREAAVAAFSRIKIAPPPVDAGDLGVIAASLADIVSGELDSHIVTILGKTRAAVEEAAVELRAAIDADLASKFMRDK